MKNSKNQNGVPVKKKSQTYKLKLTKSIKQYKQKY